jgi:uncharacterized protein (TIGR02391 family)
VLPIKISSLVTTMLENDHILMLEKIFLELVSGHIVNAKKFRAANYKQLEQCAFLEKNRYVDVREGNYYVPLTSLFYLMDHNEAKQILINCERLFDTLLQFYIQYQEDSVCLSCLSQLSGLSLSDVTNTVTYLLELPIWAGSSLNIEKQTGWVRVAEPILRYESLSNTIEAMKPNESAVKSMAEILRPINQPRFFQTSHDTDIWSLLHPKIVEIAKSRFLSEHYADSVEAALKEVNSVVKTIVKERLNQELDGADLMNRAFSVNNPVISLDDPSTETGKNVQKGYMQIFAGAMTGIRNPKAHENIIIDETRAIHFLFLASLLMFKIDERC